MNCFYVEMGAAECVRERASCERYAVNVKLVLNLCIKLAAYSCREAMEEGVDDGVPSASV